MVWSSPMTNDAVFCCLVAPPVRWRAALAAGCLLTASFSASAEPAPGAAIGNFQMVQRVDDVLYGVDAVSLEILDQRHVRGTFVRVSVAQPSPILGYTRFVADCREPVGLALVSSSNLNGKTHPDGSPQYLEVRAAPLPPDAMDYEPGALLDGTQTVAQFACQVSLRPGAAPTIAQALYEGGGPSDTQTLKCTLLPDGSTQPVVEVPLRYSESAQAVSVNHQWLASSIVTPQQIQFGSGYDKWTIDRNTWQAQLRRPDGSLRFASKCVPQ